MVRQQTFNKETKMFTHSFTTKMHSVFGLRLKLSRIVLEEGFYISLNTKCGKEITVQLQSLHEHVIQMVAMFLLDVMRDLLSRS